MWAKLSDTFYDDPKILAVSDGAAGVYAKSLSYSARHGTGGEIPRTAPFLRGRADFIRELRRVGLWEPTKAGYRVHNWDRYNPSAEEARQYQERMREVHSLGGKARAAAASRTAGRFAPAVASSPAGTSRTAVQQHQPRPVPSRQRKDKGQVLSVVHNQDNGQKLLTVEQRTLVQKWNRSIASAPEHLRDKCTDEAIKELSAALGWIPSVQVKAIMLEVAE